MNFHHDASTHQQPKPSRLRRDFVLAPITSLNFFTTPPDASATAAADTESEGKTDGLSPDSSLYLLVGEDTQLKVYDTETSRLCCQVTVFDTQPIHGIHVHERRSLDRESEKILVWGNRSVALIDAAFIAAKMRRRRAGQHGKDTNGDNDDSDGYRDPGITEACAPDWIYDGAISPDGNRVMLALAHNEIVEVFAAGASGLEFGPVTSPARPALYSAGLVWTSFEDVLVAAGTVFGEIVVWKCHVPATNTTNTTAVSQGSPPLVPEVQFVFTGHEGSIFGVDIFPALVGPDRTQVMFLASCSDDRTIRIWDISEGSAKTAVKEDFLHAARETGFSNSHSNSDSSASAPAALDLASVGEKDSAPLAVAMGHASRIWGVKFGRSVGVDSQWMRMTVPVYSFGEDSTVWSWHFNLDLEAWRKRRGPSGAKEGGVSTDEQQQQQQQQVGSLRHRHTYANHDGKHLWARAVMESHTEHANLIATGGADGRVNLVWDRYPTLGGLSNATCTEAIGGAHDEEQRMIGSKDLQWVVFRDLLRRLALPTTSPDPRFEFFKKRKENPQNFVFIEGDTFLIISNAGRLISGRTDKDKGSSSPAEWEEIKVPGVEPQELAFCTAMIVPGPGKAILGTAGRKLFLYDHREPSIREVTTMPGKITEIFCLNPSGSSSQQTGGSSSSSSNNDKGNAGSSHPIELLVLMIGCPEVMQLVTLDSDSGALISVTTVPDQNPHYVATSACWVGDDILAIGSRYGHLSFFSRSPEGELASVSQAPRRTEDSISSILSLPCHDSNKSRYVITTSRDGFYRIYELSSNTDPQATTIKTPPPKPQFTLRLRHETACPAITYVEGAWLTTPSPTHPDPTTTTTTSSSSSSSRDLILYGFRGKFFVVWNETRRHEIAAVDCGGARRTYSYHHAGDPSAPDQVRFVFGKNNDLGIFRQSGTGSVTVKTGAHGREVRSVAASRGGRWIATGSEDATVRLWRYRGAGVTVAQQQGEKREREGGGSSVMVTKEGGGGSGSGRGREPGLRCLATMKVHRAGLQGLKWLETPRGDVLFSCAGNEEFLVWRVSELEGLEGGDGDGDGESGAGAAFLGPAVMLEAQFGDKTPDGDLRIMDFDVSLLPLPARRTRGGEDNDEVDDDDDDDGFACLVTMVFSNSSLRTYEYSTSGGFRLLARGQYTGACLTQIRHLRTEPDRLGLEILTGATDGHLVVWTAASHAPPASSPRSTSPEQQQGGDPAEFSPALVTRIHQNTIKSLDLEALAAHGGGSSSAAEGCGRGRGSWLVLTGGDDNALGITLLSRVASGDKDASSSSPSSSPYKVASRSGVRKAHTAAVSGLKIVTNDGTASSAAATDSITTTFVTASLDQRIKTWRLNVPWDGGNEAGDVQITLLSNRNSGVPDPGDVELLGHGAEGGEEARPAGQQIMVAGIGLEVWRLEEC